MKKIRDKYVLDDMDRFIIKTLIKDARVSYTDLSKMIGVSRPAAMERVQNMVKAGIIERFTVDIDWTNVLALD